jgi:hypothetical protein
MPATFFSCSLRQVLFAGEQHTVVPEGLAQLFGHLFVVHFGQMHAFDGAADGRCAWHHLEVLELPGILEVVDIVISSVSVHCKGDWCQA